MQPLTATIDTEALRHNYRWLKKIHGHKLFAVVKSDAYGHGLAICATALADIADGFAVMFLEEALVLREAGIRNPILLIEGVFNPEALNVASQQNLWVVIQGEAQLHMLLSASLPCPVNLWLKMDSGMHRGGIRPEDYVDAYQRLANHGHVLQVATMTHFACADQWNNPFTEKQLAIFNAVCANLPAGESGVANSGALLGYPNTRFGWARAGLALYGVSPFFERSFDTLQPVMSLTTTLLSIHAVDAGQPVGYGGIFITKRPTLIGLVCIGYADGYPRLAQSGAPLWINGRACPLIGRPSMNLLAVDITDIPLPTVGSTVELWGTHISVNTIAQSALTDPRELLTHVQQVNHVVKKAI